MLVISDISRLIDELKALSISEPGRLALIAVDGYDRVGKSYTTERIARELNLRAIDLDDLLGPDKAVDVGRLMHAVNDVAASDGRGCIVNGVLVLDELEKAGLRPTHRIYIKALNSSGDWVHSAWTDASDAEIQHARSGGWPIGSVYPSSLIAECVKYHRKTQAHLSADTIFQNQIW